jgi:hypothetical protein
MTTEQQILQIWRQLPKTMQQEVLDLAQFLAQRRTAKPSPTLKITNPDDLRQERY